jgi:excisionase family DNA binding protein
MQAMDNGISFEQLPKTVKEISDKVNNIERLLLERTENNVSASLELLTIKQAADFLSLSVPTIYGLVQRQEIPVNKRGKRLYFSKQELTDWIKAGRKKTNEEIESEATRYIRRNKKKG